MTGRSGRPRRVERELAMFERSLLLLLLLLLPLLLLLVGSARGGHRGGRCLVLDLVVGHRGGDARSSISIDRKYGIRTALRSRPLPGIWTRNTPGVHQCPDEDLRPVLLRGARARSAGRALDAARRPRAPVRYASIQ